METTDQITLIIKLTRNTNGTMSRSHRIEGEGLHVFEIIGILTMICIDLTEKSKEIAKSLPEDVKTRPVYKSTEEHENS